MAKKHKKDFETNFSAWLMMLMEAGLDIPQPEGSITLKQFLDIQAVYFSWTQADK